MLIHSVSFQIKACSHQDIFSTNNWPTRELNEIINNNLQNHQLKEAVTLNWSSADGLACPNALLLSSICCQDKLRYRAGFSSVTSSGRGPKTKSVSPCLAGLKKRAMETLGSCADLITTLCSTLVYSSFETTCELLWTQRLLAWEKGCKYFKLIRLFH